jgi:hypothetical protein
VGRRSKNSKANSSVSKTDFRKKANRDERKQIKRILGNKNFDNIEIFDNLPTYKKLSDSEIEWQD